MAGRKRVYAGPPNPKPMKRRRKGRRRRRGARTTSYTSKSGVANSFGFKSKKLSIKKYRGMLWRDSIMKTKWRTNFAFSANQTSPASASSYSVVLYDAFGNTGSPFWTAGGGTISSDFGTAVPTFNGDIIVRGGTLGIRVSNQAADTQPQEVKIILFRTAKNRNGVAPPALANQPLGFDLTQLTDFSTFYGKPMLQKTVLLENSNVVEVKFRLKVQKFDQYDYSLLNRRFYWLVALAGTETSTATTATVSQFWNASFVADAV